MGWDIDSDKHDYDSCYAMHFVHNMCSSSESVDKEFEIFNMIFYILLFIFWLCYFYIMVVTSDYYFILLPLPAGRVTT